MTIEDSKIEIGQKTYDLRNKKDMDALIKYAIKKVFLMPKVLPTISRIILYFSLATIFALTAGILLSIILHDWLWFSRFGSVCVIIAIVLIFFDVSDYYDNKIRAIQRTYVFMIEVLKGNLEKIKSDSRLPDEVKEECANTINEAINTASKSSESADNVDVRQEQYLEKRRLRYCEAAILLIGTFVWGFGDLLGRLY